MFKNMSPAERDLVVASIAFVIVLLAILFLGAKRAKAETLCIELSPQAESATPGTLAPRVVGAGNLELRGRVHQSTHRAWFEVVGGESTSVTTVPASVSRDGIATTTCPLDSVRFYRVQPTKEHEHALGGWVDTRSSP